MTWHGVEFDRTRLTWLSPITVRTSTAKPVEGPLKAKGIKMWSRLTIISRADEKPAGSEISYLMF